jgi:hypothetical protein
MLLSMGNQIVLKTLHFCNTPFQSSSLFEIATGSSVQNFWATADMNLYHHTHQTMMVARFDMFCLS